MPDDKKAALAQQVIALKADVERSGQLRAQAQASVTVAKQQLAQIDEKLKGLGVNPDEAEQQLKLMEAALEKKVAEMSTAVHTEIAEYNQIIQSGATA